MTIALPTITASVKEAVFLASEGEEMPNPIPTGDEKREDKNLRDLVTKVHSLTSTPVGIGFGISSPSEARKTASLTEAVIVGSAIVKKIEKYQESKTLVKEVGDFAESLARAVKE